MADLKTLELEPRDLLGKKVETLRRSGLLPVHMYGPDIDSQSLQGDLKLLARLVLEIGTNIPVSVTVKGCPCILSKPMASIMYSERSRIRK